MKKIKALFILWVLSSLILTGCTAIKNAVTAKTPHLADPYSCNFTINAFGDMEVQGTLSRYGGGLWNVEITAPETMAGMNFSRNDTGMKLSLGELKLEIEQEKINRGAVTELIFSAIDDCAALQELSLNEAEDGLEYIGKAADCAYVMIFNRDTLELERLSFPALEITAFFSGYTPLSASTDETASPSETTVTVTSE